MLGERYGITLSVLNVHTCISSTTLADNIGHLLPCIQDKSRDDILNYNCLNCSVDQMRPGSFFIYYPNLAATRHMLMASVLSY